MCAHILFSKVDNKIPSFSDTWINNILRNKLNYKGLIFSDDLSMLGSGNENLTIKVKMSLDAGCDMLIICNHRSGVKEVIEYLDKNDYEQTSRIFKIKSFKKINWNDLLNNNRALATKEKIKKYEELKMRRIITGHNENGKSIITMDGPPARSIGEDVGGLFELWNTDGNEVISSDVIDRADDEIILSPPSGGTKFRYFK